MKPIFMCACGVLIYMLTLAGADADMADDPGPMQAMNRLPLNLMFLTPRPTKAKLPDHREFDISLAVEYSSTNLEHTGRQWEVLMDMEMTIVDFSLAYGVGSKMALRVDVPLVSMGDGFLDGFLTNYHDALGVPNYGREDRPENKFGYHALKDGKTWFEGNSNTFKPADVTLSGQFELESRRMGQRARSSSLLISLKIPTGDEHAGLGSGEFDAGIFLPFQWSGSPWSYYAMPGFALINDPESREASISGRNSISLFAGTAYDYSARMRLLAQLNFHTSPIESTGSSWLDNGGLELSLGFQRRLQRRWIIEFAFTEDLTHAAPDFNLRLGLRWILNPENSKAGKT